MNDYRKDIYKKYANDFKGAKNFIDTKLSHTPFLQGTHLNILQFASNFIKV